MLDILQIANEVAAASCLAMSLAIDYIVMHSAQTAYEAHGVERVIQPMALAFSILLICKVIAWTI